MRPRLLMVVALASIVLASLSCAGAPNQASVVVSCQDFESNPNISKEVQAREGGTISVTLCSNPTTGFQWEQQVYCPLVNAIVTQVDHQFVAPEASAGLGAAGREVWTFKAENQGSATINLSYDQPWEGGQKGAWTCNLLVTVK
jgi:inhibitor of cysteine peptidase